MNFQTIIDRINHRKQYKLLGIKIGWDSTRINPKTTSKFYTTNTLPSNKMTVGVCLFGFYFEETYKRK